MSARRGGAAAMAALLAAANGCSPYRAIPLTRLEIPAEVQPRPGEVRPRIRFGRLFHAGFPSRAFDRLLEGCQHRSEWDTLGQPDPLPVEALRRVVAALRERGVSHREFTGGEPLLRLDAVEAIARDAAADVHACPFCHGAAGNCLRDGLDASIARLRGHACAADAAERLVSLRRHGPLP